MYLNKLVVWGKISYELQHSQPQEIKFTMIFKVKGQSHIKMHFYHYMSKNIGRRALVSSCTTIKSKLGTKCEHNFPCQRSRS